MPKIDGHNGAGVIHISSPDDPAIADFRNIRERDLVLNHHRLVLEGKVILQHLLVKQTKRAFGHMINLQKILILENRLAGLEPLLKIVPKATQIYVAKRDVMDAIAGFPIHRGILALADFHDDHGAFDESDDLSWLTTLPQNALILVLSNISNHDNVGSIFRNAAAFGADFIVLDQQSCHPFYRKSIRVSAGATLTVPFKFGVNLDLIFDALTDQDFTLYGLTPSAGLTLSDLQPARRSALVLGAEGYGLDQIYLKRLVNLKIEQTDEIDSLNVGMAGGLALWHIATKLNRL